jgi:hypothetical protein
VRSINLSRRTGPTVQRGFDVVLVGTPLDFRIDACTPGSHWVLSELDVDALVHQPGGSWLVGSGLRAETLRSATVSTERSADGSGVFALTRANNKTKSTYTGDVSLGKRAILT